MALTQWEDVHAAVVAQCVELLDGCLPPPCAPPPPLTCDLDSFRCELDLGSPETP